MQASRSSDGGQSHLFLLRLWAEQIKADEDQPAHWQGRVQHVITGQARSFDDWPALIDLLLEMLPMAVDQQGLASDEGGGGNEQTCS